MTRPQPIPSAAGEGRLIVDPHHHLWADREPRYLLCQLEADFSSVDAVIGSIYVEARWAWRLDAPELLQPVGETEWVCGLPRPAGALHGIIGFADLARGEAAAETIAAHIDIAGRRFVGIRHSGAPTATSNAPPDLLKQDSFGEGLETAARLGLCVDTWLHSDQLPMLIDLAHAHPDVTIILDHFGGPVTIGRQMPWADVLAEWRDLIAGVAECNNVRLKLGGIGMPFYGLDWNRRTVRPHVAEVVDVWAPIIAHCIDSFGAERCMFESNFPVDSASLSYATVWEVYRVATEDRTADERSALFAGTAIETYGLVIS
jgi:L-fuconolactonase